VRISSIRGALVRAGAWRGCQFEGNGHRLGPEDPDRRRMGQLLAWQASNPPPPGLNRAQLEGLIRATWWPARRSARVALATL
jgi:hypothetical protein